MSISVFPVFFKLRLGAFIPKSVGLSTPKNNNKFQNFTKPYKTVQHKIKH